LNVPTDMGQQYGETPYSRPQRFVVSYQYEFPFKAGGALSKAVEGWSASGSTVIQGGNPLTLFDGRGGTIYYGGPPTNGPDKGSSRAQLCPGKTYNDIVTSGSIEDRLGKIGDPNTKGFFNPAAFCAPPQIGNGTDFGNTGVGIVHGPGQANFDFSLSKLTRITEKQSVQFRAEFFNLFNHPQFGLGTYPSPTSTTSFNQQLFPSSPTFGVINQAAVNPRLIQFALRLQF